MIKFSLSRILEESPYNLILSGTDFRFITDFGIHYSVSFNKEDIVLGECETYQLIIRKIDENGNKQPVYLSIAFYIFALILTIFPNLQFCCHLYKPLRFLYIVN